MGRDIPALTVRQPWAWAIVAGLKDIENRTWQTSYRGPLYIHAAQQIDVAAINWIESYLGIRVPRRLPRKGIIGVVRMTECVSDHDSPWFFGPVGWVLTQPRPLRFLPLPGQLGLWRPASIVCQPLLRPRREPAPRTQSLP